MPHDYKADRQRLESQLDASFQNCAVITDLPTMAGAVHAAAHPEKEPIVLDWSNGIPENGINDLMAGLRERSIDYLQAERAAAGQPPATEDQLKKIGLL